MNRRGLLLGAGALLVGEPVRRAYSFLQDNPLALSTRELMQRFIQQEIRRALNDTVSAMGSARKSQVLQACVEAVRLLDGVASAEVGYSIKNAEEDCVLVQLTPQLPNFNVFFEV